MPTSPVHVTVSGGSGNVTYALLTRIASGQLLGPDQPVVIRLLDIEPMLDKLEGVVMELEDGAYPLLHGVVATHDLTEAFDGTSWALMVGSVPRKEGMERGDLLKINGGIFGPYGAALNEHAASDVRVLVVGNPCNTNCLIMRSHAPDIPDERWFAMTRLDENRAKTQLAKKAGVHHGEVSNIAIWGNHSATQFPDFADALIQGKPAPDVIGDDAWLQTTFLETVQKRGAAIIEKRGQSSAASAAHAIVDSVNSVHTATPGDDWHSLAVVSHGEYGVPDGLLFSYPVRSSGDGWSIVEGIEHDAWALDKIAATTQELVEERDEVRELLGELTLARYALVFGRDGEAPCGDISLTLDEARGLAAYDAILDLGAEHGVVAVRDDEVPLPRQAPLVEVRADGLWAEVVHEADDHWSLGLEAFGLRFATVAEAREADVGERVPVGYDLEWDRGRVVGELLVGRARVAVDTTGTFTHTP